MLRWGLRAIRPMRTRSASPATTAWLSLGATAAQGLTSLSRIFSSPSPCSKTSVNKLLVPRLAAKLEQQMVEHISVAAAGRELDINQV